MYFYIASYVYLKVRHCGLYQHFNKMTNKKRIQNTLKALILLLFISSCQTEKKQQINVGKWRGMLINNYNDVIPFQFNALDTNGKLSLIIINADERILVNDIQLEEDSIKISMPFFDAELRVMAIGDSMSGYWIKHLADKDLYMPFRASKSMSYRFAGNHNGDDTSFNGTWPSYFVSADKTDSTFVIGQFTNTKDNLFGTFLSSTGDYRYLEGIIKEDSIFLSTFDGSHAYLFKAARKGNKLLGSFSSGFYSKEEWIATLDPEAKLPNPDSLTFIKEGFEKFAFKFNDTEGNEVSLEDERFKNKIVIIQIMGTWCPNCLDESQFLTNYYGENKSKGIEVIGLCYERSSDKKIAARNINQMRERLSIPYPLLIAGTNKKGNVNESLPMLKNFVAFPTMIILDANHNVKKIHTGYSGPATGMHYIEFKEEFENFMQQLLQNKQ